MNTNIPKVIENIKLQERLREVGIYPNTSNLTKYIGPTARCNKSSIYIFKW